MNKIKCQGWCNGTNAVTHIGSKGYIYCATCAAQRRASGYERCRKMKAWELKFICEGKALPSYEATKKPPPCAASMGCLCAGHARGNLADAPCDTREQVDIDIGDPEEITTRFYVDIPDTANPSGANVCLASFATRKEAITWAKDNLGADDEGRLSLISEVEE